MSIRKTVEVVEVPNRDRYGQRSGSGWTEAHVATTIVHDVVHLSLSTFDSEHEGWDFECEVNMTNDEARMLIAALAAAIADNESQPGP